MLNILGQKRQCTNAKYGLHKTGDWLYFKCTLGSHWIYKISWKTGKKTTKNVTDTFYTFRFQCNNSLNDRIYTIHWITYRQRTFVYSFGTYMVQERIFFRILVLADKHVIYWKTAFIYLPYYYYSEIARAKNCLF